MMKVNEQQQKAIDWAHAGRDFLILGPAGSGKSSLIARILLDFQNLHLTDFRVPAPLGGGRYPGYSVLICAWTNTAVANLSARIRAEGVEDVGWYCQTIHNALEYRLERVAGIWKHRPRRGPWWPIDVTHLIIDEVGMLGSHLWEELQAALPRNIQKIFLADIHQLPAAFGTPMLYNWLTTLPHVELTTVYRQKSDNPLLDAAFDIRDGHLPHLRSAPRSADEKARGLYQPALPDLTDASEASIWRIQGQWLLDALRTGTYDPDRDIILCPFRTDNRLVSSHWFNAILASWLAYARQEKTWAITCAHKILFFAVGDKIRYLRYHGVIVDIRPSPGWTYTHVEPKLIKYRRAQEFQDIPLVPNIKRLSHLIDIELTLDNGDTRVITVDEVPKVHKYDLSIAHALSVHKAQGKEWRRVFLPWAEPHLMMATREMLYTAVTRATESTWWLAPQNLLKQILTKQELPGESLKQKIQLLSESRKARQEKANGNQSK